MATAKKQKDGTWRIQPCITVFGEKRRTNIRADSKREAEQLAQDWIDAQGSADINSDITLNEAICAYIEHRRQSLSPSTIRGYLSIARSAPKDILSKKLLALTQDTIQSSFNKFAITHSPKTVSNVYGLVSSTIRIYAPHIKLNVRLPRKEKVEMVIPSHEDVQYLISQAQGKAIEIPLMLAVFCGLRQSEVSGLHQKNIHIKENVCYISVKEAIVQGDKGPVLKGPKSISGYRDIPLHKELAEKLLEATQKSTDKRVTQYTSKNLSRAWIRFTKVLPIKHITFHSLRHYYASNALLKGVPIDYVVSMMGHSSRTMVEKVYKHLFPENQFIFASALVDEYQKVTSNTKAETTTETAAETTAESAAKTSTETPLK